MFGFIKNLLRRPAEAASQQTQDSEVPAPSHSSPAPQSSRSAAFQRKPVLAYSPGHGSHSFGGNGKGPGNGQGSALHKCVEVPLQSVLASLPLELQPYVLQQDVGNYAINVPLEKVLSQLSRGSVRISFGELRVAAPAVFADDSERDRVLVPLPLNEILSRLNPTLIQRRRVQKQIEIPQDIVSPFDLQNQGLIYNVGPGAPEPAAAPAPVMPRHAPGMNQPGPGRKFISSAPAPQPPTAVPPGMPAPLSASRLAAPELPPAAPLPMPSASVPLAPAPSPIEPGPALTPAASPVPSRAPEVETIIVGLTSVAESWPESVRKEVVTLNLVDAKVAIPCDAVEQSLKQGRIVFSWKTLRSWIRPAVLPTVSANDNLVLELPLKVVAPIFLARQKEQNKGQNKVAIDSEIPNLFFGTPQKNAPEAAVARPADTNYYVWDDAADTVVAGDDGVRSKSASVETRFISKYATPNEIVSRAAALDGVAGALIALPDGLMVANRLPPDLNPDTVAAFLPQIFAKMSQCTKELRMGELNNLNFTVGNVPWKIFRVNAIFFAAFGKIAEPLPTGALAALASELDHKPK